MSARATPPPRIVEALPEGKVLGGFARLFTQIFRPEIEARFLGNKTPCAATPRPASSRSDSE